MSPDLVDLILQNRPIHLKHLPRRKGMVGEMEATMMVVAVVVDITVTRIREGGMDTIDLLQDMAEETEVTTMVAIKVVEVVVEVAAVMTVIDTEDPREEVDTMEETEGSKIGAHQDMIEE